MFISIISRLVKLSALSVLLLQCQCFHSWESIPLARASLHSWPSIARNHLIHDKTTPMQLFARRGVVEYDPSSGKLVEVIETSSEGDAKPRKVPEEERERPTEDFIDESYDDYDDEDDVIDATTIPVAQRKSRFADVLATHPKFATTVQENRRTLAYPSQRSYLVFIMIFYC